MVEDVSDHCWVAVSTISWYSPIGRILIRGSFLGPFPFLFCICCVLENCAFCWTWPGCCWARHPRAVHGRPSDRTRGEKARRRAIDGAFMVDMGCIGDVGRWNRRRDREVANVKVCRACSDPFPRRQLRVSMCRSSIKYTMRQCDATPNSSSTEHNRSLQETLQPMRTLQNRGGCGCDSPK